LWKFYLFPHSNFFVSWANFLRVACRFGHFQTNFAGENLWWNTSLRKKHIFTSYSTLLNEFWLCSIGKTKKIGPLTIFYSTVIQNFRFPVPIPEDNFYGNFRFSNRNFGFLKTEVSCFYKPFYVFDRFKPRDVYLSVCRQY
jgi:hypothetical protein